MFKIQQLRVEKHAANKNQISTKVKKNGREFGSRTERLAATLQFNDRVLLEGDSVQC